MFAFPPESLFAFSPESRSSSPRNAFHVHPGILFAFARNPQMSWISSLLAGFQVTFIGRIWVTTEGIGSHHEFPPPDRYQVVVVHIRRRTFFGLTINPCR